MKKMFKGLLTLGSVGLVSLTLASCGGSTRNTTTPYAGIYNSNDIYVATATNDKGDDLKMSLSQFYSRLRYSAYNTVFQSIKTKVYEAEYKAVKEVLTTENLANVSEDTKKLLTLTKNGASLYELSETTLDYSKKLNNYEYIRKQMVDAVTSSLSSLVFTSSSSKAIEAYEDDELEEYYTKFIEARARVGVNVTKADLAFTYAADDTDDLITFTNFKDLVNNHEDLLKTYLIAQAEKLAGANALYQIADEEYIYPYDANKDEDEKTKNSQYYLFEDDSIKSAYNSGIKNYATHKAVVTMFNSRSDAMNAVAKVEATLGYKLTDDLNEAQVKEFFLNLYQNTYKYKSVTDLDDEEFTFEVTPDKNELSDLTTQAQTLITTTLKDGEYLKEARNLNDKYYLVYHISSVYDTSSNDEAKDYEDLTEAEKKTYDTIAKFEAIYDNATGYSSTEYKNRIYTIMNNDDKSDDLMINDPVMENKFYAAYSDVYSLMDKDYFKDNVIYSYNGYEYKVEDFYKEASVTYGTAILTNYFQLEYAYQFADDYLTDETKETNETTVNDAISEFESGKNASYSSDLGTNNFLLLTYGYETKEDVLKYYFNAKECLSQYTSESVYKSFAKFSQEKTDKEGSNAYVISDTAKDSFLKNILATGNAKYSKLFNIELDHFLINIDADGDGTPDDPDKFTKKFNDAEKQNFENSVTDLARALYIESVSGKYGVNSYYSILSYIKTAYEEGADLKTPYTSISGTVYTNWNDFKEYNFLVTVEELSSSGAITETSVSNFVVPFKEYVENVYEKISEAAVEMDDYKDGLFYLYNKDTKEGISLCADSTDAAKIAEDSEKINMNTLCKTVFGYHVLLVLDYDKPDSTKYTKKSDSDYQLNLAVILYQDADDEANNVVVYTDSLNDKEDEASFNQFFVYYVQKQNNQTSSLTSTISSLMSKLFDEAIAKYTSTNFQTYLLLKQLNIQIANNDYTIKVKSFDNDNGVDVEYYANQIIEYKADSDYKAWVDGTYTWSKPANKVEE